MIRKILTVLAALALTAGCAARLSTHPVRPSALGAPTTTAAMLDALAVPGVATVEKIVAADWRWSENFATPGADPPDWTNGEIDGQVYFYRVRHPAHGLILIDAGLPVDTVTHLGPIVRHVFDIEHTFALRTATAAALAGEAPRAVFLTHLHWDHVLGVRDLPGGTLLYIGPGDGAQRHFLLRFIAPITRRALAGHGPLNEWRFTAPEPGELAVIDIFGDGSIFALHTPGHTPGSTAYIVNADDGAHFIIGDAIHTREGWRGERTEYIAISDEERAQAWDALARMQSLAARIPRAIIHPGHEDMNGRL